MNSRTEPMQKYFPTWPTQGDEPKPTKGIDGVSIISGYPEDDDITFGRAAEGYGG